jgi:mono/diheme cytochrome c family protein
MTPLARAISVGPVGSFASFDDGKYHMKRYIVLLAGLCALGWISHALAEGLAPPAGYKANKKIKRLFEAKCSQCHGDDGVGKTELGVEMGIADMTKAAYWKDLTLESARKAVWEGLKRTVKGKEQEMKPFKDRLSVEQVDALILYAASLKK